MQSPSDNRKKICPCKKFVEDLVEFFLNTDLSEQHLQWNNFKVYLKQYSCHIYEVNGNRANICSQDLCTILLRELKNHDTQNGRKLLTKTVNIIGFIYAFPKYRMCLLRLFDRREGCLRLPYTGGLMEEFRIRSALEGKSKFMKLLVNLDLLPILNNDSRRLRKMAIVKILNMFILKAKKGYHEYDDNDVVDDENTEDEDVVDNMDDIVNMENVHDIDDINDIPESPEKFRTIVKTTRYLFSRENYDRSYKRIYLTMIAILAAQFKLMKKENTAKDYIFCLRTYFIITRDPLIAVNEFRIMLYVILNILEKLHLFESLYGEFTRIMPECSSNLKPRSLADLVRWQIRETLKKCNLNLPAAVVQLNLPQLLKEFVLGDVIQLTQLKRNISPEHIIPKLKLNDLVSESSNF